jgi:hypothetical protein
MPKKRGGGKISFANLNFSKWGGQLPPAFFQEGVFVMFKLQTHMEHLS